VGEYEVSSLSGPDRIEVSLRYAEASPPAQSRPKPGAPGKKPAAPVATSVASASSGASSSKTSSKGAAKAPEKNASEKKAPAKTTEKNASLTKSPAKKAPSKSASEDIVGMWGRTSGGTSTLTRMLGLKVNRIVLDPGHGGTELGAVGPGGLYEKDLTLAIARELKTALEKDLGMQVILTRNSDINLPLERRTAIANAFQADLFVSIHANSSTHRSLSGVETYYFDFAKTDAEREVAARENASSTYTVGELENLIKKIAVNDKVAESKELASIVQKHLFADAQKLIPASRDRGVRSAPFVVLIGAHMPSILAEVSFISNPEDEKLLGQQDVQKAFARALYSGIAGYVDALGGSMARGQSRVEN